MRCLVIYQVFCGFDVGKRSTTRPGDEPPAELAALVGHDDDWLSRPPQHATETALGDYPNTTHFVNPGSPFSDTQTSDAASKTAPNSPQETGSKQRSEKSSSRREEFPPSKATVAVKTHAEIRREPFVVAAMLAFKNGVHIGLSKARRTVERLTASATEITV